MQNFTFWNPTRIVFGRDTIPAVGQETAALGRRALLVYGGGSIKASGVYELVIRSLEEAGVAVVEHGGVRPNPVLGHLEAGIALARREGVEVIVAVGGGSVIDEGKAIAAGVPYAGDVWDLFTNRGQVAGALPLVTVLTLAATGSEMNKGCVITNEAKAQKFNLNSPHLFPRVSILDPTVTFSVPPDQSANGAVDATVHLLEGYLTGKDPDTPLQDRLVEGLVRTIRESAAVILERPDNYPARATMMWAATLALNGLAPAGIGGFGFPSHMIEHSLSALYDIAHGAGLAIVLPAWMTWALQEREARLAQLARRVFDIEASTASATAAAGIAALRDWFAGMGCPVTLAEAGIPAADIPRIAHNATMLAEKWGLRDYTAAVITDILERAR